MGILNFKSTIKMLGKIKIPKFGTNKILYKQIRKLATKGGYTKKDQELLALTKKEERMTAERFVGYMKWARDPTTNRDTRNEKEKSIFNDANNMYENLKKHRNKS